MKKFCARLPCFVHQEGDHENLIRKLDKRGRLGDMDGDDLYDRILGHFCGEKPQSREELETTYKKVRQPRDPSFGEFLYLLSRKRGAVRVHKNGSLTWLAEENPLLTWLRQHDLLDHLEVQLRRFSLAEVLRWSDTEFDQLQGVSFSVLKKLEKAIETSRAADENGGLVRVGKFLLDPEEVLGRGSNGTVVYFGRLDGRDIAVKRLDVCHWQLAEKEVHALQTAKWDDTPHLVSYFGTERRDGFIYIGLSRCSTSLAKLIADPPPRLKTCVSERIRLIRELAVGLQHLHALRVIHRDLTPSNVLLDDQGVVKLSDMGLARIVRDDGTISTTASQGTLGWQPSEVLANDSQSHTEKIDVFAFGCIAFFTLTLGQHPFGDEPGRVQNILKNILCLFALHKLQGILVCAQHPKRQYKSKYDVQQHVTKTGHCIPLPLNLPFCHVCFAERKIGVRCLNQCEVAFHSMFASENLILSCVAKEQESRLAVENILKHPLFWHPSECIVFLQRCSDMLKARDVACDLFDRFPHEVYRGQWMDVADMDKLMLGKYENKMSDLVRLVRNISHHFREQNLIVFESEMDVWTFFELRFPKLLTHVWSAVSHLQVNVDAL